MKFLMIFVVLFEELFKKLPKVNKNVLINLFIIVIVPLCLVFLLGWMNLEVLQIAAVICGFIFFIIGIVTASDGWNPILASSMGFFLAASIGLASMINEVTISEVKEIPLTENMVKYKGFKRDVTQTRKDCIGGKYNLSHYKMTLFDFVTEDIKVSCADEGKVQEIQSGQDIVQKVQEIK